MLILVNAEKALKSTVRTIKLLTKEGKGIYVTLNRPYDSIKEILKKNNVDTSKLFFIDCITESASGKSRRTKDCLFISSIKNLTELSIAITQAIHLLSKEKNKFLYLDALSTFFIYHSAPTVTKFSHLLMSKLKLELLTSIFLSVESEMDERIKSRIISFCDKVITVGEHA